METTGIEMFLKLLAAMSLYIIGVLLIRIGITVLDHMDRRIGDKGFPAKGFFYAILVVLLFAYVSSWMGIEVENTLFFFFIFAVFAISIDGTIKTYASNAAAKLSLLLFKTYKVGDNVQIGNTTGVVEGFNWCYTKLRLHMGESIVRPNHLILNEKIVNLTKRKIRLVDINILVPNELDTELVKSSLLAKVGSEPLCLKNPAPRIFVNQDQGEKVILTLQSWLNTADYDLGYERNMGHIKTLLNGDSKILNFNGRDFETIKN